MEYHGLQELQGLQDISGDSSMGKETAFEGFFKFIRYSYFFVNRCPFPRSVENILCVVVVLLVSGLFFKKIMIEKMCFYLPISLPLKNNGMV